MKNGLDEQYIDLLKDILENGVEKDTRNGKVLSVFGRQIRHKMSDGFPLLTTKKMYFKGIVTELLWFLRGDTNIKYLVDNGCHIWDGDAYKAYKRWIDNFPTNLPDLSKTDFPKFYKLTTEEELNDVKATMDADLIAQEFQYNSNNLWNGKIRDHIRHWIILCSDVETVIDFGGYISSNALPLDSQYISYTGSVLSDESRILSGDSGKSGARRDQND